jgi:hypothetical protein
MNLYVGNKLECRWGRGGEGVALSFLYLPLFPSMEVLRNRQQRNKEMGKSGWWR